MNPEVLTNPGLEKLWAKLVQLAHDSRVAARLVALERRRLPHLCLRECLEEAIRRLLRDRGVACTSVTLS